MTNPYPLPRETRETPIIAGDGRSAYGPFAFRIWDATDLRAVVRRGESWREETVVATKVAGLAFDHFTITFSPALTAGQEAIVQSKRLQERSTDVTRGGAIAGAALEGELSRLGSVVQELRRDLDRAFAFGPGSTPPEAMPPIEEGRALVGRLGGTGLEWGPDAREIVRAEGHAETALAAASAAGAILVQTDELRRAAEAAKNQAVEIAGVDGVANDNDVKGGTSPVKVVPVLQLLSRLKFDGYLAVRHFGVKLDGTDETNKINGALTEAVPLKFPRAVVPLYGPLDLQNHSGILGSGEGTLLQRRFSGGALVRHRAGGEPIILQDFRLHTADGQALALGDTGMEFGLVTPWAQRGVLNNILIQRQYDGFHWRRGSDGVISNVISQENVRYGFLGINPRGVLYKCNGNFNGRSGFMCYYDDVGETGVDFDLCRSFCNQYFGWEFGADGAKQTLNANANFHRTVTSFDGFGGIRCTIPFQQFMVTDHLAEYHGFAQNFRPDFMQDEGATGLFLTGGMTLASIRGLKSANNKGPGARINGADVEMFDWRIHQNGRGLVSRAGLELGAGAKVYGGGLRFTDGGTSQIDIAVVDASATGQLSGIEATDFSDAVAGTLRFENVTGAMGNLRTIASAATVLLPRWGEVFVINGATRVTALNGGWVGRKVTIRFTNPATTGGMTVGNNIAIAGNYTPANGGTISLVFDGGSWIEIGRTGAAA